MEPPADEYAAFEKRVKRTVYVDNLSPLVTEGVLKAALDQFGDVVKVDFIPNYINPHELPRAALVEMQTSKQALDIIDEMANSPFMVSGMPRPVRACAAKAEMFQDRPRKPGRKITVCWLNGKDPNFEMSQKIKRITVKHAAEAEFLLKNQLAEEEKLANQQAETLKANYKKFELIDGVVADGTAARLAQKYNMHFSDA